MIRCFLSSRAACLVAAFLIASVADLHAQSAWDRQLWGNHRAVVEVGEDAPAVRVHLSWRREDDPSGKAVFVVDAASGRRVAHVFALSLDRESGDFIFEPSTGKGEYYFYYMPYRLTGSWYFPSTVYRSAREAYDTTWANTLPIAQSTHFPKATVLGFESVDAFDSFDPMEVIATRKETDSLLAANKGADFLVFPEDRKQPIRMERDLPSCWMTKRDFEGTALRNEFYTYQLGVYAARKDIRRVRLSFTDLVDGKGARIPATAMRCFNFGGKDWQGHPFTKVVDVPKGNVQALWVGIDLPHDVRPGLYDGSVTVGAEGLSPQKVAVHLRVRDSVLADRGYGDLFRMARLNWLDSDIGLDDSVFKPYTPLSLRGNTVYALGRTLRFDRFGLPEQITSTFEGCNASAAGPVKNILAAPMAFNVVAGGKPLGWNGEPPVIREQTGGAVRWTTRLEAGGVELEVDAKMECDGYVNYQLSLTATKDMDLDDVQMQIPYARAVADFMMGLGHKGGKTPDTWEWKWEKSKANNMFWIGDVNAGLQCKLKNETPDWTMTNFDKTGTYKDWSNDGLGGANLATRPDEVLMTAYTGKKHVVKGQVLHFNFGLLITPVKLLDPAHWDQRYFQADPPVDNWRSEALAKGANIMNVHQGNVLNPYINYPFIAVDTLQRYVAVNRALGIRTKVYYTVRELSNRAAELWAFRSLGDEIFTRGLGSHVADQFADDGLGGNLYCTGGPWLVEHLGTGYDAAWHTPLPGGDYDMAIRTQGLSRLHNYYLEGLNWLVRNTGIRGIYLDGVGYDREIMKRVRKVMDRAADSCLIDMHSGNNFSPTYGLNSPANQYMELFPFLNSLWLGEGYNYNESPDYWLVEVSGIPFGLFGEMLNGGGNAYRGMLYGMTNRLGWTGSDPSALWRLWDNFGIQSSHMQGYWDAACPVRSNRDDVKVTVYRKAGKVLIAYASWAPGDVHVRLDIDWKSLHLNPKGVTIVAPTVQGLQEERVYNDLSDIPVSAGKGGWIIIQGAATANPKPFVIPGLQAWEGGTGDFHISRRTAIVLDPAGADSLHTAARILQDDLKELTGGRKFPVRIGKPAVGDIALSIGATDSTLGAEGYVMDVRPSVLRISAGRPQGVFWGTRTLLQVLAQDSLHRRFPCGVARDYPKYAVRGFVLDDGRMFFSMDFLKRYVKAMAWYKMNDFHIHLNDNGFHAKGSSWDSTYAAFRLECDTYPALTAKDGSYTKKEFREFEAFARSYGVNIVPEIDVPAHSLAFTRMRPEIGSRQYGMDHLDLDNPVTYRVIDSVFGEYLSGPDPVFSGPDVHIGTDEYNKKAAEQFRAFTDHYIRLVQGYGKKVRLWGALTHAAGSTPVTSKGVTMNVWYNGYADPREMEKLGYDIISTPDDWVYIVPTAKYYHDFLDTAKLFKEWEPIQVGDVRFPEGDPRIIGGSFAVWNDKLGVGYTDKDVDDRVFPAMRVLSQKMWRGTDPGTTWEDFCKDAARLKARP